MPPSEHQQKIGWYGSISREVANQLLSKAPAKTFLIRWSDNVKSYVVSYKTKGDVHHIAGAKIDSNSNTYICEREDGTVANFPTLVDYVNSLKKQGSIADPLPLQK